MASISVSVFFFLSLFCTAFAVSGDFILQTSQFVDDTTGDVVAAFGDFNADKRVDIFVIKNWGE